MKRIVLAIPHSHTWFWTQTCLSSLMRNPPVAKDCDVHVVVVDNSPWSPAIKGIVSSYDMGQFKLSILDNYKSNKFHASALDCVVDQYDFDYLMAFETDVMALRPTWLQWFVDQMKPTDFAVGMWHHEQFVNPSCTLYRGDVLRAMNQWCKGAVFEASDRGSDTICYPVPSEELRWGRDFERTAPLDNNLPLSENPAAVLQDMKGWIGGPFAEKRGFHEGTQLKEPPSGQEKGPGWYEPGQQLHAWAVQAGYTYTVCPSLTSFREDRLPLQSMYGPCMVMDAITGSPEGLHQPDPQRQLEAVELFGNAQTVHLWGGTRALDILKHPVTCEFVKANTPMWLAREARFWKHVVPQEIQERTLRLIRRYGWHITGQGSDHVSERDKEAANYVRQCYALGGVEW